MRAVAIGLRVALQCVLDSPTMHTRHEIATVEETLRVSIERKKAGTDTTITEPTTASLRGTPRAENESAATMKYDAAVPRQLPITAMSMATPKLGAAASQTVASDTGPLWAHAILWPHTTSRYRLVPHMPADNTHRTTPAEMPDCANAKGSERRPVPMQVEERLTMHESTLALPAGADLPSSE